MGRAYTNVIPPEYQVMATQVTNYGEPRYAQFTPQNTGTIGRSVMGSNDMQDRGEPEVYSNEIDPLAYAGQQTAALVAKLKRETSISQTPNTNVERYEGTTKVTYNDISRDGQVSNVQGFSFTGDPEVVSQALKHHEGSVRLANQNIMDGSSIQATLDRASSGMGSATRGALETALQNLGPAAISSLPQTALAGLRETPQVAGVFGLAGLPVHLGETTPNVQAETRQRWLKAQAQVKREAQDRGVSQAAKKSVTRGPTAATLQHRSATSTPQAFVQLAQQKEREAKHATPRLPARYHPAQSGYEDSSGQSNGSTAAAQQKRQAREQFEELRRRIVEMLDRMTPAQRAQAEKALAHLAARWEKMTPQQRQAAVKQIIQAMQAFAAQAAARRESSAIAERKAVQEFDAKDLENEVLASKGDDGAQTIREERRMTEKQAQAAQALMRQLAQAWKRLARGLNRDRLAQLQFAFNEVKRDWLKMSPAERRAALVRLGKLAQQLLKEEAEARKQARSGATAYSAPAPSFTEEGGGVYSDRPGSDYSYFEDEGDVTSDSSGEVVSQKTNWTVVGGLAAAAAVGGLLIASSFMKGGRK